MEDSGKTIDEIRLKFKEVDELLDEFEIGLKKIEQFSDSLNRIDEIRQEILQYYHGDWDADVIKFHNETHFEHFKCSNQDSIWNITQDFYKLKIELLKKIANSL